MYVKRHAVRWGRKRYVYLRLVQAYRDEQGRVRHRVLKTLGREDELKASWTYLGSTESRLVVE
jgi:hypothetical protein